MAPALPPRGTMPAARNAPLLLGALSLAAAAEMSPDFLRRECFFDREDLSPAACCAEGATHCWDTFYTRPRLR